MRKNLLLALLLSAVSTTLAAGDFDLSLDVDGPDQAAAGTNVTFTLTVTNDDTTAAGAFVVTDELPAEMTFVSCSATGGGVCGGSGNNRSIAFSSLAGEASVTITIVANVSCSNPGDTDVVDIGEIHPAAADPDGDEVDNDSITVTILRPQIANLSATPSVLWPPNHKFVDVAVNYAIIDNCGAVTVRLSVTSNEPVNGTGDGDTAPDWQIVNNHRVRLRAERAGNGSGRMYTITVTATDSSGASSSASVDVRVPHDTK